MSNAINQNDGDNTPDQAELFRLQRMATIANSACGGQLGRIRAETEGLVEIDRPRSCLHYSGERYLTEPEIFEATMCLTMYEAQPIDLRGNVRQQYADQLRLWAEELIRKSHRVLSEREEPFSPHPRAYILREIESKRVISHAFSFEAADMARTERYTVNRTLCEIVSAPIAEFPNVLAAFEAQSIEIPPIKSRRDRDATTEFERANRSLMVKDQSP